MKTCGIAVLLIAFGLAQIGLAQEPVQEKAEPAAEKPQSSETAEEDAASKEKAAEPADEEKQQEASGQKAEDAEKAEKMAEIAEELTPIEFPDYMDELWFATSVGWAYASKDGDNWRASGATDLLIAYTLVSGAMPIFLSFRYLPLTVAPKIGSKAYEGVFSSYLFGGGAALKLQDKMKLLFQAEIGYGFLNLEGQFDSDNAVNDSGLNVGAAVTYNYQVLDRFSLGVKVAAGFVFLTSAQVALNASFNF